MAYNVNKLTNLGQMKSVLLQIKSVIQGVQTSINNKILFAESVQIGSSAWTASGNTDYPYKATFTMTGITADYLPIIEFRDSDVLLYDFASYATTGANSVTVYCKTSPSTTITLTNVACYHGTKVTVAPVGV